MPVTVVVGTQWGDEGKGKVTDYLADRMQYVVRYQGGNNAGHTIKFGDRLLKLNLVPSAALYSHIVSVIADGVVADPRVLFSEIEGLAEQGIETNLRISGNTHLIMPYHIELEKVTQRHLGKNALGTTKRGIGPAYADKAARIGIRVQDLLDEKIFRQKLDVVLKEKNAILTKVYGRLPLEADAIVEEYKGFGARLAPMVVECSKLLNDALDRGENVLLEGAQGTMLDLDHGTYPFVTSSNPVTGSALASTGIGPKHVERVIGITKAYVTRVGAGPFPTRDDGVDGDAMGERGAEFGTTTGRKRDCGWFDAVVGRYSARLNGLTEQVLTKLDVLSGFSTLKVCSAYRIDGELVNDMPANQTDFHHAEPVYEEVKGWENDLTGVNTFADLPVAAQEYVRLIEQVTGVSVSIASVGPDRQQTLEVPAA